MTTSFCHVDVYVKSLAADLRQFQQREYFMAWYGTRSTIYIIPESFSDLQGVFSVAGSTDRIYIMKCTALSLFNQRSPFPFFYLTITGTRFDKTLRSIHRVIGLPKVVV